MILLFCVWQCTSIATKRWIRKINWHLFMLDNGGGGFLIILPKNSNSFCNSNTGVRVSSGNRKRSCCQLFFLPSFRYLGVSNQDYVYCLSHGDMTYQRVYGRTNTYMVKYRSGNSDGFASFDSWINYCIMRERLKRENL